MVSSSAWMSMRRRRRDLAQVLSSMPGYMALTPCRLQVKVLKQMTPASHMASSSSGYRVAAPIRAKSTTLLSLK
jgi:hypothetical protein